MNNPKKIKVESPKGREIEITIEYLGPKNEKHYRLSNADMLDWATGRKCSVCWCAGYYSRKGKMYVCECTKKAFRKWMIEHEKRIAQQ